MTATADLPSSQQMANSPAALIGSYSAVANTVRSAKQLAGWEQVPARDGTPTFCRRDLSGAERWHGRTTMPRIRGEALIEQFAPGSGNVALVGVGHGIETRMLLDRLSPAQSVFIIEPDTAALAAALQLTDFAADIAGGRLRLFTTDAAWDELAAFLREHEGYLVPDRILHWPWFAPADVAATLERFTQLSRSIEEHRRAAMAGIPQPAVGDTATPVELLIVGSDGDASGCALGRALQRAAGGDGRTVVAAIPDRPDSRHALHLTRTAAAAKPVQLLLINAAELSGDAGRFAAARRTIWLTADARWSEGLTDRMNLADRVIVPTQRMMARLRDAGIAPERMRHVPVGGDAELPLSDAPAAVDQSPEAVGLRHSTHQSLWRHMVRLAGSRIAAWSDDMAEPLLAAAESAGGVVLGDAALRRGVLEAVCAVLGPGAEINAYCGVWERRSAEVVEGGSRPILFVPRDGLLDAAMLAAALQQRPMLIRRHPRQSDADGWCAVLDERLHAATFATTTELDALLQQWRRDPAPFQLQAAAAQQHVLAAHCWSHRLAQALQS